MFQSLRTRSSLAGLAVVLAAAGCAHHGYFLEESTRRIYSRDYFGRVTKWYEPGTKEYDAIALRFWPQLAAEPVAIELKPEGRRAQMAAFMKDLDKNQWHILLDLELWTGEDLVDLAHLEDLEAMASAVKGLAFDDYMDLKGRYPGNAALRARLLHGDRQ